jgi:hypothetical protein
MLFFLDLFVKIGENRQQRNRGGFCSELNETPAGFEITGTLTVSAPSETLGAPIAVLRRYPGLDVYAASQRRRTDTGTQRGDFRLPAAALNGHRRPSADLSGGSTPGGWRSHRS